MIVSEIVVAILLAVQFNAHSGEGISPPIGVAVIVFICLFVAGFGWSWGPLGWLVPNEIQPLETRSAGQVNLSRFMQALTAALYDILAWCPAQRFTLNATTEECLPARLAGALHNAPLAYDIPATMVLHVSAHVPLGNCVTVCG